ncbi:MAG: hypothetical protein IPK16_23320 [Anaerolineales bacterium]|nr:hypothetical protein [Anaerolineales bacterium]
MTSPLILGAGAIGIGDAIPKGLDLSCVGAAVVGPVSANSNGGADPPRLAHCNGGAVLNVTLQNRGVGAVMQRYPRHWQRIGVPVVVQLADAQPRHLVRTTTRLRDAAGISGFELLLPADADAALVAALVRACVASTELPVWAKLPLPGACDLARAAVEAGAAGLVLGQAAVGAAVRFLEDGGSTSIRGALFGPGAFAPMMAEFIRVAALELPAVLIASGGIHTVSQVRQALSAGASAVQIDSAIWVEPALPQQLYSELQSMNA